MAQALKADVYVLDATSNSIRLLSAVGGVTFLTRRQFLQARGAGSACGPGRVLTYYYSAGHFEAVLAPLTVWPQCHGIVAPVPRSQAPPLTATSKWHADRLPAGPLHSAGPATRDASSKADHTPDGTKKFGGRQTLLDPGSLSSAANDLGFAEWTQFGSRGELPERRMGSAPPRGDARLGGHHAWILGTLPGPVWAALMPWLAPPGCAALAAAARAEHRATAAALHYLCPADVPLARRAALLQTAARCEAAGAARGACYGAELGRREKAAPVPHGCF